MQINLNEYAVVVLTEFGADIWNARHADLRLMPGDVLEKVAAGDTLKEQLWNLMQVFGPSMMNGMPHVPFAYNKFSLPVVDKALAAWKADNDYQQRLHKIFVEREETARKMIATRDAQIDQLKACLALAEARVNRALLAQDRAAADERRMVSQPHQPERRASMQLEPVPVHAHDWVESITLGMPAKKVCCTCGVIVYPATLL